jgi:dTDP-4-amino-4,6-dideoxygalactose transaminase
LPGLLRFPLRISDKKKRESLLRESTARGLGIMTVYPTSINAIPELKGKFGGGAFPVAESCARELVTLPTHGYLTEDDVSKLSRLISRILG